MTTSQWDDALRTGHLGLDLKHKRLASCLEQVIKAQRDCASAAIVDQLLLGLWKATEIHFAEEEELMRRIGFPAFDRHVTAHRRILQILAHRMDAYQDVSCDSAAVVRTFQAWFSTHTTEEDAALGAYVSSGEVQRGEAVAGPG